MFDMQPTMPFLWKGQQVGAGGGYVLQPTQRYPEGTANNRPAQTYSGGGGNGGLLSALTGTPSGGTLRGDSSLAATTRYNVRPQQYNIPKGAGKDFRQAAKLLNQPLRVQGTGFSSGGGGIWSDEQIQQQVNALRGKNDATTAGRVVQTREGVAGRGMGSNSPLAQALQATLQGQNLVANTEGERQLRWDAAEGNAKHRLETARLAEESYANRMQEQIAERQIAQNRYNALLDALTYYGTSNRGTGVGSASWHRNKQQQQDDKVMQALAHMSQYGPPRNA